MLRSKINLPVAKHAISLRFLKGKSTGFKKIAFFTIKDKPEVRLRGVHDLIDKLCPHYSYEAATKDATPPALKTRKRKRSYRSFGMNRGRRLDTQLTKTLDIFNKHLPPPAIFYDKKALNKTKDLTKSEKSFLSNRLYLPEMKFVWAWFEEKKIRPVATQVNVGNTVIGRATPIDLVGQDIQGRWVLFEFKDGHKQKFFHHTGKNMKPPFQHIQDSKFNQAHLQLLLGLLLFRSQFPSVTDAQMSPVHYIVRVDDVYIDSYELAPWALEGREKLSKMLS